MILALLSIAAMVVVLLWQKRIQQQFQNPELMMPSEISEKRTTETPLQTSGIDFLVKRKSLFKTLNRLNIQL